MGSKAVKPTSRKPKELTGKHVLTILVVFFGLIITSSIVFTTLAVKSFRGEDVKGSYRQGIDYNRTLESRAADAALGWEVAVNVIGDAPNSTLLVQVVDADQRTLTGLEYTARLRHPVDSDLDRDIALVATDTGIAKADLADIFGQWTLQAEARNADHKFRFSYDLNLK